MRVLISTAGSVGDVAPYTGVGQRLAEAGYQVAVAAHESFAELVGGAGLTLVPVPGDARAIQDSPAGRRLHRAGTGPPGLLRMARLAEEFVAGTVAGLPAIVGYRPELLLASSTTAVLTYQVAEALGVPSAGLFLQPVDPTAEFAPVMAGAASLGRVGNRAAARAIRALARRVYRAPSADLRRALGLPPISLAALDRRQDAQSWPVLHGYSPRVVPRPADWRPGLAVVGYWWPPRPAGWTPPAALVDFLAAGPPPVCVGFGSMAGADPAGLGELVVAALRRAGVRGVLLAGWAGLAGAGADVLTIGAVPHDWLFPRMSVVVHHGGGGTTAAALRAGVPTVPVPMIADQGFWAARTVRLGVSPVALPVRRLTADRLAAAITAATGARYRRRATALAAALATEDGAGAVLALADRLTRRQDRPGWGTMDR